MSISWILPPSGELTRMIQSDGCTFDDVIAHPKIKENFKRQDHFLTQYLLKHIKDLTNIALGLQPSKFQYAQMVCFNIITSQNQNFSKSICQCPDFYQCMLAALFDEENVLKDKSAAAFTRIFQNMSQTNTQIFLNELQDREKIFARIVKLAEFPPFANLLQYLTEVGDPRIVSFLEDCNATLCLLDAVEKGDVSMKVTYMKFIIHIIDTVDNDSILLEPFNDNAIIEKIYKLAMTADDVHLSAAGFKALLQLCSHIEEGEDGKIDGYPLSNILKFVSSKLDEICAFIQSDRPFLEAKFHLIEIISGVSLTMDDLPDVLLQVCGYLFDQMFAQPQHSFLHRSFLTLFEAIMRDSQQITDFIDNCHMHDRIIEAYAHKRERQANYWFYLFTLSDYIMNRGNCDDKWRDFIATTYSSIATEINKEYGGPLPHDSETDDMNDFEYFNPEDEEDYDDHEEDDWHDEITGAIASSNYKESRHSEEENYSSGDEIDDSLNDSFDIESDLHRPDLVRREEIHPVVEEKPAEEQNAEEDSEEIKPQKIDDVKDDNKVGHEVDNNQIEENKESEMDEVKPQETETPKEEQGEEKNEVLPEVTTSTAATSQ